MKYVNKIICLLTIIIGSNTYSQELSFDVSGQFHLASISEGNSNNAGGGVAFGVNYHLSPNLSLNSGAGVSLLNIQKSINTLSGSQMATDEEGENFEFQYTVDNYIESSRFGALNIPLTIQYESLEHTRFFVRAGASYTIPFAGKSSTEASQLTTTGFYERFNATISEPRFAGFGEFNDINFQNQDVDIKGSINLVFEAGIGIRKKFMSNKLIYASFFAEIGLNDIREKSTNGLLTYNTESPTDFITTSVLNATNSPINDKTKLFLVGIRLRVDL